MTGSAPICELEWLVQTVNAEDVKLQPPTLTVAPAPFSPLPYREIVIRRLT